MEQRGGAARQSSPALALPTLRCWGAQAAHPAVSQLDGGPAFPLPQENLQPPESDPCCLLSQWCEAFWFYENPHLAPMKTPPVCGTLAFQSCFSILALEGWARVMGRE